MAKFLDRFGAALIDMDGVLYDSMKGHTLAWHRLMTELGVKCDRDEFYLYEGMTGKATVNLLFRRAFGREADEEEVNRLYARKAAYFRELGEPPMMPGAARMLAALGKGGLTRILVTGSAQGSLLDRLDKDYPGVFPADRRITALNVSHGKPDPEPYLKGASLAGVSPERALVVENAPLGVRAGKAAGAFTVAVTTGPIPRIEFEREGADAIFSSMEEFADWLERMGREELQEIVYSDSPREALSEAIAELAPDRWGIVTDPVVREACGDAVGEAATIFLLDGAGEVCKSVDSLTGLWSGFSESGFTRRSVTVNLGGGSVSDTGGFAAATFKRGIRFINMPTTLLGAADAAVGGKTGIDLDGYKNEVGAFAPAERVIICGSFFRTLPETEVLNGIAEIVKTALISSGSFYAEVVGAIRQCRGDDGAFKEDFISRLGVYAARCADFKSVVVALDPRERGRRKILNFGHTVAHALEALSGGELPHGIAVAYGIYAALLVSETLAGLKEGVAEDYRKNVLSIYPPLPDDLVKPAQLVDLMGHDKKNPAEGDIRMVLLASPGAPLTDIQVQPSLLCSILPRLLPARE